VVKIMNFRSIFRINENQSTVVYTYITKFIKTYFVLGISFVSINDACFHLTKLYWRTANFQIISLNLSCNKHLTCKNETNDRPVWSNMLLFICKMDRNVPVINLIRIRNSDKFDKKQKFRQSATPSVTF